jgi:hypothetical protein
MGTPAKADTAKTSDNVTVTTSTTAIVAANSNRHELILTNDGTNVVYLALATSLSAPTAVANKGIRLNPGGGCYQTDSFTGAVAGIASGGSSVVCVTEI